MLDSDDNLDYLTMPIVDRYMFAEPTTATQRCKAGQTRTWRKTSTAACAVCKIEHYVECLRNGVCLKCQLDRKETQNEC